MSATVAVSANQFADPADVFDARCWARARLWSTCDIPDLLDAVDPLQTYAEASGLIARIGQDAVQKLIGDAFMAVRL